MRPDEGLTPIGVALVGAAGVGRWGEADRRADTLALLTGVAAIAVLAVLFREPDPSLRGLPFFVALLGAAFAVGRQLQGRALEREDLQERRERLEQERAQEVARAVIVERERIAAELHAIIRSSVDRVAAGAARAEGELDRNPVAAVATLQEVRAAASGALTETRRLLGLLRTDGAEYAPQPGLAALADRARSDGYDLRVAPDRSPVALPAGLELALVRIVEEAVGAVEPARRSAVRVEVAREPSALAFSVTVDGAEPPWRERDPLLAGMRERVRVYGGELVTVAQGAGWALRGRLPVAGSGA